MFRASKAHLAEVGEDYFEHLKAALGISVSLAQASLACTLHAFVPGLCTRTASRRIAAVQRSISRRAG